MALSQGPNGTMVLRILIPFPAVPPPCHGLAVMLCEPQAPVCVQQLCSDIAAQLPTLSCPHPHGSAPAPSPGGSSTLGYAVPGWDGEMGLEPGPALLQPGASPTLHLSTLESIQDWDK